MGATVDIDNMPAVVHQPYAFLLDETGVEPIVERNGYGKILLTHLGERTKMTIAFRLDGRGWRWENSKLFIDGEKKPLANGWDQYVSIFKDPDNGRRNHIPKGAKKAKLPESNEVDEQYLPKTIATCLASMRKAATKDTVTVVPTISKDSKEYLVTVADSSDGSSIALVFEYVGAGDTMEWSLTQGMAVNAMGYDVTHHLSHSLEDHLMAVLGANSRAAQVPTIPGGSVQGASGYGSADIRKNTVRRV
ncbi:hypothetical protein SEA_KRADAL_175 [Streptomyces phage Kradal]|nr:hypothetical protein SEA_KRADAL_175 [Streptomyces phage Kradal]QPL14491.1 hypothetical protein SEA_EHYELIMAYOE_176 [Streptomyces phage EhyElimayoE]